MEMENKKLRDVAEIARQIMVGEELKGGQVKLDKNHNGKIDGQDFKILRGEKKTVKEEEQVEEGWDDMLKSVKDRAKPQPSGGSGIKQGTRYGGSKQKDTPEHDEDKKKVTESKRPDTDNVPFVTDESKPLTVAKDIAKKSMKRMKTEMLGKISN